MPRPAAMSFRTLLLGMGNPILRDDAIGIRLALIFQQHLAEVPGLEVIADCSLGGLNLLHLLEGFDRLIVIDSIQTREGTPGVWHQFSALKLRPTRNLGSIHDANFSTVLELGRRLGMNLPEDGEIHIFAVEILDNRTFSECMSAPMEGCLPRLAEQILARIREILA